MPRIKIITESKAEGQLKILYDKVSKKRGAVSEVLAIHSLLPETMSDHFKLYMTLMFDNRQTGITRKQLEMIAVTVSAVNKCSYCVAHHSVPLGMLLKNKILLKAIQTHDIEILEKTLSPEEYILIFP